MGKIIMKIEDGSESEENILSNLSGISGDYTIMAQYYIDKNRPVPEVLQEYILNNYNEKYNYSNFIINNFKNDLAQKILNSDKIKLNLGIDELVNYFMGNKIKLSDKVQNDFINYSKDYCAFIMKYFKHP